MAEEPQNGRKTGLPNVQISLLRIGYPFLDKTRRMVVFSDIQLEAEATPTSPSGRFELATLAKLDIATVLDNAIEIFNLYFQLLFYLVIFGNSPRIN